MSTLTPSSPAPTANASWIDAFLAGYARLLEVFIGCCLVAMVVLVFGNVILRYVFNSGISVSEELSRWLFVWLTFMGSILAMLKRRHLGTEVLVGRLGPTGRKVCLFVGYALMFIVCWLLFRGSLEQVRINWDVSAPSSGFSMATVYVAGLVFSVSAAIILAIDLLRLVTGRLSETDLIMVKENEDQA